MGGEGAVEGKGGVRGGGGGRIGFDSLTGQGEKVCVSLRVNFNADLFVLDPPSNVRHAPRLVRMLYLKVKDPIYPSVVKDQH